MELLLGAALKWFSTIIVNHCSVLNHKQNAQLEMPVSDQLCSYFEQQSYAKGCSGAFIPLNAKSDYDAPKQSSQEVV
jgi:hypothetical protein